MCANSENLDQEKIASYSVFNQDPTIEAEARMLVEEWVKISHQSKYPYMTNNEYKNMLKKKTNK